MQVFGYLRFSFYGRSDAQLSHREDEDNYLAELYDAARMEDRFHFFEHLCLPSLRYQTDMDYTLIVLASEVMPEQYKSRLKAITENFPQVVLVFSDKTEMSEVFNEVAQDLMGETDEPTIHFRLDDDDGLGAFVIQDLRKMAENVNQHTVLSMPSGVALVVEKEGVRIYPVYHQFLAIGFAFVNMPGHVRNPFQCAHFQIARRMPSMMDPRPWSYLHLLHEQSDSALARGEFRRLPPAQKITREDLDKGIRRFYPSYTFESLNTICNLSPGMIAKRAADKLPPEKPEDQLIVVTSK